MKLSDRLELPSSSFFFVCVFTYAEMKRANSLEWHTVLFVCVCEIERERETVYSPVLSSFCLFVFSLGRKYPSSDFRSKGVKYDLVAKAKLQYKIAILWLILKKKISSV